MHWISHRGSKNKVLSITLQLSGSNTRTHTHRQKHTCIYIYASVCTYFFLYVPHARKAHKNVQPLSLNCYTHYRNTKWQVRDLSYVFAYYNIKSFFLLWTMSSSWNKLAQNKQFFKPRMDSHAMASATRSGVMGPVFTEIHKSSSFEFFFFLVSDLEASPQQQQQQQRLAWRQQQQWQHTTTAVRKTSRGSVSRTARQIVLYAPWLCLSTTKLQSCVKKSWMLSNFPSITSGCGDVALFWDYPKV